MAAVLPLALIMLVSTPPSGNTLPPTRPPGDAQSFSMSAGRALGAAATWSAIARPRIDRDADAIGDTIEQLARDAVERTAAHRTLLRGVGEGGDAVDRGTVNCTRAELALEQVERQVSR